MKRKLTPEKQPNIVPRNCCPLPIPQKRQKRQREMGAVKKTDGKGPTGGNRKPRQRLSEKVPRPAGPVLCARSDLGAFP